MRLQFDLFQLSMQGLKILHFELQVLEWRALVVGVASQELLLLFEHSQQISLLASEEHFDDPLESQLGLDDRLDVEVTL